MDKKVTKSKRKNIYCHESSYIDAGAKVGSGTKIWHFCHISKGAKIGKDCVIGQNVFVGEGVKIGDNVKIQNNVSIYSGVTLEDDVFCGPSMVFTNVLKPRCKYPVKKRYKKTLVQRGATIGANATIVCGNTIGRDAFIAAGAVVASDIPQYALMLGVPAKQKGWVCECGCSLNPNFSCSSCNKRYTQRKKILVRVAR
ncbi:DapH/DapD/GlmU-related protein [Candidatus Omnitrophota bacterium]